MVRKSPVRHTRKAHSRKGNSVKTHSVGNGSAVNPTFVYPKKEEIENISNEEIKFDSFTNKYKVKPSGDGWRWSNNIVVNPNDPKEQWVKGGGWIRKPSFLEKKLPSILSIRLQSKEERNRGKLEGLVNKHGLDEGVRRFKNL